MNNSFVAEYKEENEKMIFFDVNLDELNDIRKGNAGHMKNPFFIKDRRSDLYL